MEELTSQSHNGTCFAYEAMDMLAGREGAQSCLRLHGKHHTRELRHTVQHTVHGSRTRPGSIRSVINGLHEVR